MRSRLPDGVKVIAEGDWGTKIVYECDGNIYLRGFGDCDYVWFDKATWNDFAKVIIEATKIINGGGEGMTELKTCPFCKAKVEIRCLGTSYFIHHPDTDCVLKNTDIPTIMEAYRSENELVDVWNRRVSE